MSKLTGSKKATQFTESVIREMTRLNQRYGGVNLSQGFPDFPAPDVVKEAACAAIRADVNQYAVTWGTRALREAIAREFSRRYGVPVDAGRAGDRLLRRHRSDDGHHDGDHRSGRRGRDLRAVLRELRPRCDPVRRDAALRAPRAAGASPDRTRLDVRCRRAGGGLQRANQGDHPQHAQQPDGQGVHPRRARDHRRALPQVGRHRDLGRDLRAHHLRRRRHVPIAVDRRDVRSHGDDQQPVEDLQRDRLARRLDDLSALAHGRHPQGSRFPHGGGRGAAAGSRCRRAGSARFVLRGPRGQLPAPARPAASASSNATASTATSRAARTTS